MRGEMRWLVRLLCLVGLLVFFFNRGAIVCVSFQDGWEWNCFDYVYLVQAGFDSSVLRIWPASRYASAIMIATGVMILATSLLGLTSPSKRILSVMVLITSVVSVAAISFAYVSLLRLYGSVGRPAIAKLGTGAYLLGACVSCALAAGILSRFCTARSQMEH